MTTPNQKFQFVITAVLHTDGEVTLTEDEVQVFVNQIQTIPVLNVIGNPPPSDDDMKRIQMTTLHQLLTRAADKINAAMKGTPVQSMDINMNPPKGERH